MGRGQKNDVKCCVSTYLVSLDTFLRGSAVGSTISSWQYHRTCTIPAEFCSFNIDSRLIEHFLPTPEVAGMLLESFCTLAALPLAPLALACLLKTRSLLGCARLFRFMMLRKLRRGPLCSLDGDNVARARPEARATITPAALQPTDGFPTAAVL